MIDYGLWFLFPISIVVATIAMMSGIGGAVLFSPIFMLLLKLEPILALGSGLFIEVFGFSSGVIGYLRLGTINFQFVRQLIPLTVFGTVLGVLIGRFIPTAVLIFLLSGLLLLLAYRFLHGEKECAPKHPCHTGAGKQSNWKLPPFIRATSFFGGLLLGMISSGLGEINEYNFLQKMQLGVASASGTSVFLVASSAIIGVISHLFFILAESPTVFRDVLSIVVFAVPGVLIGAQLGVRLSKHMNPELMGKYVGALFLVLGMVTMTLVF